MKINTRIPFFILQAAEKHQSFPPIDSLSSLPEVRVGGFGFPWFGTGSEREIRHGTDIFVCPVAYALSARREPAAILATVSGLTMGVPER